MKNKLRAIFFGLFALCVSFLTTVSSNYSVLAEETHTKDRHSIDSKVPEEGERQEQETEILQTPDVDSNFPNILNSESKASFDFSVRGEVPTIAQPTTDTCWAAGSAMMVSYKQQKSLNIESVMDMAGDYYRQKFDNNQGLYAAEERLLFSRLGMTTKEPANYTAKDILTLLQTRGPLLVINNEGSTSRPALHARVITGISGDGTPEGTQLKINDPDGGKSYTESWSDFAQKFEDVANVDAKKPSIRLQIAHF